MNTRLKVSETMDPHPATAADDPSVLEAARTMRDRGVGYLLMLDGGRLRGLLTERDILTKVVADGKDPSTTPCSAIMTATVATIGPEADILTALAEMRTRRIRRLPVLDNGTLVGIITERGISQVAPELMQIVEDWQDIAHPEETPGRVLAYDTIRIEGVCEVCGNDDRNLHEAAGSLLCEECLEAEQELEPAQTTDGTA